MALTGSLQILIIFLYLTTSFSKLCIPMRKHHEMDIGQNTEINVLYISQLFGVIGPTLMYSFFTVNKKFSSV